MYIAVDFDGTIVEHAFPEIGKPVSGAIKWLKRFQELGAKLILFTMRSDSDKNGPVLTDAINYLTSNGIDLYGINTNPTQHEWTSSPKAYAHIYIDDAAFGCPLAYSGFAFRPHVDWSKVGPKIEKQLLKKRR